MGFELMPHQKDAVRRLRNGSILCGGVGSGKTITSLYYYFAIVCGGKIEGLDYKPMENPMDLYVITTAKNRDDKKWQMEALPFLIFEDQDLNVGGNKLVVDSWNNISKYTDVENAFFIFDEQRVVGYGEWSKSFIKIAKKNKWILLTATPGDVWLDYIPVFIANGFYKNKTEFCNRHVVYNKFVSYPLVDRYLETQRLVRLRDIILVNMYFERKVQYHPMEINVKYDEAAINKLLNDRWNFFEDKPIENASQLCYLMRRVVNSDLSRVEAAKKLISQIPKAIIFYSFDYELEILRMIAEELGYEYAEWNGHKHQPIPKADQWVYIVNYTAGCEGWDCIETDTIIFYSQSYSYKVMTQASGRIDRLNTPFSDLYYYHLISKSKIDMAIKNALERKQNFNESAFVQKETNF